MTHLSCWLSWIVRKLHMTFSQFSRRLVGFVGLANLLCFLRPCQWYQHVFRGLHHNCSAIMPGPSYTLQSAANTVPSFIQCKKAPHNFKVFRLRVLSTSGIFSVCFLAPLCSATYVPLSSLSTCLLHVLSALHETLSLKNIMIQINDTIGC